MEIVIGVTKEPESIHGYISKYQGDSKSLTEVGPFLSFAEANAWLECLKETIGRVRVVSLEDGGEEAVYYGFTFECREK